jgi:hypothetical protein
MSSREFVKSHVPFGAGALAAMPFAARSAPAEEPERGLFVLTSHQPVVQAPGGLPPINISTFSLWVIEGQPFLVRSSTKSFSRRSRR